MINVLSKFSFHANREESLWKRKEAEHGHSIFKRGHDCPKDIYYCPDTSPLVMTPGNPSAGEELFRKGYFDDVCRYFLLIQSWLKLSCSLKKTQMITLTESLFGWRYPSVFCYITCLRHIMTRMQNLLLSLM